MSQITTFGLDTSKHVFHVVGIKKVGKVIERKQLRRSRVLRHFAQRPASVIGIEACGGSHYWARQLQRLGHTVRMVPPRDVKAQVVHDEGAQRLLTIPGFGPIVASTWRARAVVSRAHKKDDPLSRWVCQVQARRGRHKATVALANKMARMAWAITVKQTEYDPCRAD